jgi:hypothetical protein
MYSYYSRVKKILLELTGVLDCLQGVVEGSWGAAVVFEKCELVSIAEGHARFGV